MVNEAPGTDDGVAIAAETADVLQGLIQHTEDIAALYRDPSVPEGAVIGQSVIAGQQVQWTKPGSMVRAGKVPLPERFTAWDRDGNPSELPTAQMSYMLQKKRADAPSERAFHTHTRGMTRESCTICPAEKPRIATLCQWCTGARGRVPTFTSEDQIITHQKRYHPEEFEAYERAVEREERRAELEAQRQLAEAMMAMAQRQVAPAVEEPPTSARRRTSGGE